MGLASSDTEGVVEGAVIREGMVCSLGVLEGILQVDLNRIFKGGRVLAKLRKNPVETPESENMAVRHILPRVPMEMERQTQHWCPER